MDEPGLDFNILTQKEFVEEVLGNSKKKNKKPSPIIPYYSPYTDDALNNLFR